MKLKNRFSGQELVLAGMLSPGERSLWRLRKRIKDFDNFVQQNRLVVSFLTVTQSDKSVSDGYRWITGVMSAMQKQFKRAGEKFVYVAVLEIQPKRYREKGVLAAHWHVAIGCSLANAFPHAMRGEDGRIKKVRNGSLITWDWLYKNIKQKFGMYFVCDCWSSRVYDYLGKYIAKGGELDEFRKKIGRRVRVFSGSRVPVQYQMSDGQVLEHAASLILHPELADLYWRREDSRIVARAKCVQERFIGPLQLSSKVSYPRVRTIPGDWLVIDGPWNSEEIGGGEVPEK